MHQRHCLCCGTPQTAGLGRHRQFPVPARGPAHYDGPMCGLGPWCQFIEGEMWGAGAGQPFMTAAGPGAVATACRRFSTMTAPRDVGAISAALANARGGRRSVDLRSGRRHGRRGASSRQWRRWWWRTMSRRPRPTHAPQACAFGLYCAARCAAVVHDLWRGALSACLLASTVVLVAVVVT